jgi:predicted DNA-binding transcriptional regulator AlpA
MQNDVPRFLRLSDLQDRGIAMTHQAVRHMQLHEGFPRGRLLGPGTRVWTVAEINQWLDSRPVEVSEQARRRAQRSIEARKTARDTLANAAMKAALDRGAA